MRRFVVSLLILVGCAGLVSAQATGTEIPKRVPIKPGTELTVTEIPALDWSRLMIALEREDWEIASGLVVRQMDRLAAENDKFQLAQLRYLRLFVLAGLVNQARERKNETAAEEYLTELDLAIPPLIGKELLMPARPFAPSCAKKLNVVCYSKDQANVLRTTTTVKDLSGILAFEYVVFEKRPELLTFDGNTIFVGGTLRKIEFNEEPDQPYVIRMFLNKGFTRVVLPKSK